MVFSILLLTDLLILCFSVSSTLHSIQRLFIHLTSLWLLEPAGVRSAHVRCLRSPADRCSLQLDDAAAGGGGGSPRTAPPSRNSPQLKCYALKLTRVIWTVRFWSTSSTPASPNSNFPKPKLPWTPVSSHYVSISFSGSVQRRSWSAPVKRHPLITLNAFKEEGVCVFSCR